MNSKQSERRWKLTRVTKTHVWVLPYHFGANPPRGYSRRIPIDEFQNNWMRLPQKEVQLKS